MKLSKLIFFGWACLFSLGLAPPATINTNDVKSHTYAELDQQIFQQSRLVIAQDNSDVQEARDPGLNPENRSKPSTTKKTKQEELPSKAKTESLPSYEPSEKIKADQAVDFPYDI